MTPMGADAFFDTNVLIYAVAADDPRAERARALIAEGGNLGVQALNEFVNVSRRKLLRDWADIDAALEAFRTLLGEPLPLTAKVHDAARTLARDHGLAFYDALMVAAAMDAGCATLLSEDMQDGRVFGATTIRNPFV